MFEFIDVHFRNQKKRIKVYRCSFFGKFLGLMFSRKEKAKVLLFDFSKGVLYGIHSYFVFYDFLAVWLDEKNNVIQVDKVRPWISYLRPKRRYVRLIEIPINKRNRSLVEFFGY